ncbi:MAG: hypothetical protein II948_06925 [Synergistaceae bacterium]|nr:hypothetical protein [Synergistaceae bacterium]MBQ6739363.1 hypothetical protein [Synergistaceae bacterium]MBQ6910177.1 hypothetical protein [Synergistaceae bacterium]MBQ9581887.1 hypothetical protein [Synergistaceae bacterium]MBR0221058.1 hypothetical protein [Synergistaceae bacterium]
MSLNAHKVGVNSRARRARYETYSSGAIAQETRLIKTGRKGSQAIFVLPAIYVKILF